MKHSIVTTEEDIIQTAKTAEEVWREYYTPLLGDAQVSYMVENFQSAKAITKQIEEGYTYYLLKDGTEVVGYVGICPKDEYLFLSKLYVRKEARGKGFASKALAHRLSPARRAAGLDGGRPGLLQERYVEYEL